MESVVASVDVSTIVLNKAFVVVEIFRFVDSSSRLDEMRSVEGCVDMAEVDVKIVSVAVVLEVIIVAAMFDVDNNSFVLLCASWLAN